LFSGGQETSVKEKEQGKNIWKKLKKKLEPIIRCKHPIIALGATPIGSAGRAPNRKSVSRRNSAKRDDEEEIGAYDRLQVPEHRLRGYSHQECWSHTRRRWKYQLHNRSKLSTSSSMLNNR
jgi:hypothetical protein